MSYLTLFLQTWVLETLLLLIVFRGKSAGEVATVSLWANAFTHPWVVFGWLAVPGARLFPLLLGAEAFAIVVEGLIYWRALKLTAPRSFSASLAANLLSWQLGPILSFGLRKYYVFL